MRCSSKACGSVSAALLAGFGVGCYKVVQFSDDNRELWFKYMQAQFWDEHVPVDQEVLYAIETGLADISELQSVMRERVTMVERAASDGSGSSSGGATWEWFKNETTRISGENPNDLYLNCFVSTDRAQIYPFVLCRNFQGS